MNWSPQTSFDFVAVPLLMFPQCGVTPFRELPIGMTQCLLCVLEICSVVIQYYMNFEGPTQMIILMHHKETLPEIFYACFVVSKILCCAH